MQEGTSRKRFQIVRKISIITAGCLLSVQVWTGSLGMQAVSAATAAATVTAPVPSIVQTGEEIITAGAVLKNYVWTTTRNGNQVAVNAKVIQVDLKNPYVKLNVMTGVGEQLTKRNTVLGMAQETGAVAGVNGDYFNTQGNGAPIGPEITEGEVVSTPSFLKGLNSFAITKDNKPVIDMFTFQGQITAADGSAFPLAGVNKSYYWFEPSKEHSHANSLYIYTHSWGSDNRANDGNTVPTEVLVVNNVVTQIQPKGVIHMVPPSNGYILRASGKAADYITAHLKVGDPLKADYAILPLDPTKKIDLTDAKMMIGGHTILVDQGKPAAYTRDVSSLGGYRARTGIGFSKDERYVYLITADSNGDSKGLSLAEFQNLMVQVGVWRGMNLDGGGSTQMVSRPQFEQNVKLANAPEYNYQRPVVNGLGVYTLAPKGSLKGLKIEGEQILFLNEKTSYRLKGYDQYYNPVSPSELAAQWTMSSSLGIISGGNTLQPTKVGKTTLTASVGAVKTSYDVQVVGHDDLAEMRIKASPDILMEGSDVTLSATVKTKDGGFRSIPADLLHWEVRGDIDATINGSTLHVNQINGANQAQLIASYDGYSTILELPTGTTKLWGDFDHYSYALTLQQTLGVTGAVYNTSYNESYRDGMYGELWYDFTNGTGTKAAYAAFGKGGAAIQGTPSAMKIDIRGDNSLNWLRMEVVDANGQSKLVDLAKAVNWNGWKTLTVDLSSTGLTFPLTLKRVYVASIEQGQDERALTGAIGFDNIRFTYKNKLQAPAKNQVQLTINKKSIQLNGGSQDIDQAPVIVNGNTLVPIRFVSEALGGEIRWNGDERKVTVIRGGQMMEFRLGSPDYVADGMRKTAMVSPELRNGRTMVPLRVLSEHFGWKVTWDPKTRTITLE